MSRSSATVEPVASRTPVATTKSLFVLVAHVARLALGAVYLYAGGMKALNPTLFAEEIAEYGITPAAWSTLQAPLFIMLELALGVALVVNYRPRLTIPLGTGLMLFFIGVLAVAVANGYDGSCGCFGGASARGPAGALAEDIVFLAFGVVAWIGMRIDGGFGRRGRRAWQTGTAALGAALAVAAFFVAPRLPLASIATAGRAGAAFDHIVVEELDRDLSRGDYLAVLLHPEESASIAAVRDLDRLSDLGPPLIGVFEGDNERMVTFIFEHLPPFNGMGHAPHSAMRRFYRRLPVVLALRDGIILAAWHERVPTAEEARAAFAP